ncbi:MAG: MBL fold metallo-hydrolase, partial [Candidatus Komeilibacteria bacterium]|nr:MBL fold metallo-hydrolase [Candidatus Komeilibacteria bacterium]
IYIDPYKLAEDQIQPANYVFITHGHFDHCSPEDLKKIVSDQTIVIASAECQKDLAGLTVKQIHYLKPGENLGIANLRINAVQAYNINKFREPGVPFHLPGGDELGYIIQINGVRIYHAGDTDNIPEMADLENIHIALLPVSGTYVMTPTEAAAAAKVIQPKIAIPMHYGSIVGTLADAEKFKQLAEQLGIKVEII